MSQEPVVARIDRTIRALVSAYGPEQVLAAVERITAGSVAAGGKFRPLSGSSREASPVPSISRSLAMLKESDANRYELLSRFLIRVNDRDVLPEAQDLRFFADRVGLIELAGKSRKSMVANLMRHLFNRPIDLLKRDLMEAESMNEQQRRRGFSVLTAHLLNDD